MKFDKKLYIVLLINLNYNQMFNLTCGQFAPLIAFLEATKRIDGRFCNLQTFAKFHNDIIELIVISNRVDRAKPSKQFQFTIQTKHQFGADATFAAVFGMSNLIDIFTLHAHQLQCKMSDFEQDEDSKEYNADLFVLNLATNKGADLKLIEITESEFGRVEYYSSDYEIARLRIDKIMLATLKSFKDFTSSQRLIFERINMLLLDAQTLQLTASNVALIKRQNIHCNLIVQETEQKEDGFTYDYAKGIDMNLASFLEMAKIISGEFMLVFNLHSTVLTNGIITAKLNIGYLAESQTAAPTFDELLGKFDILPFDFKLSNKDFEEIGAINIVAKKYQMLYFSLNAKDGKFIVKGLDEDWNVAITLEYNRVFSYDCHAGIFLQELIQAYKAVKVENEDVAITIIESKMMQLQTSRATVVTALRMMEKRY